MTRITRNCFRTGKNFINWQRGLGVGMIDAEAPCPRLAGAAVFMALHDALIAWECRNRSIVGKPVRFKLITNIIWEQDTLPTVFRRISQKKQS